MTSHADAITRPIVICIDVEPSERQLVAGSPPRWRGWELAGAWIDDLRPVVRAVTGRPLVATWFVRTDPQVAEVFGSAAHPFTAHEDLVERALTSGDRVGVHVHSWRATDDGAWVDDQGDGDWTDHCIDVAVAGFHEGFGARCQVSSLGARFMSDRAAARLEHHGVGVDVSTQPGWSPVAAADRPEQTADLPDYRRLPRRPYRPAVADFRREAKDRTDGRDLVFLPLAAAPVRRAQGVRSRLSDIRHRGWRARRTQPISLNRMGVDRTTADRVVDAALTARDGGPLAFAVRTDWDLYPDDRLRADRSVAALLAHPTAPNQRWVSPEQAVARFTV